MKIDQIAIQLYTLREQCKTTADFAATLKKVRSIGYTAIQVSGIGPIPEEEIIAIAKAEGLTICATHEPSKTILQEPQKVVERLGKLGCRHTAYPFPNEVDFTKPESLELLVSGLEKAGELLRRNGLILSYHNHAIEFVKCQGKIGLDFIYESTSARNLQAEIDTYWIQYGGGDVVDWCRKLKGRLPLLHLKDFMFTAENKATMTEIGNGTLNFKAIIQAAEESGCEWYIVEQDSCPGDPFDSIKFSFDYLTNNLVTK